jgi:hypothetical protein
MGLSITTRFGLAITAGLSAAITAALGLGQTAALGLSVSTLALSLAVPSAAAMSSALGLTLAVAALALCRLLAISTLALRRTLAVAALALCRRLAISTLALRRLLAVSATATAISTDGTGLVLLPTLMGVRAGIGSEAEALVLAAPHALLGQAADGLLAVVLAEPFEPLPESLRHAILEVGLARDEVRVVKGSKNLWQVTSQ